MITMIWDMQPIIHDFVGYRVLLVRADNKFVITIFDEQLEILDEFVESEDDQAAIKFEQVVYNLHIAKEDFNYRLPLMDYILED